MAELQIFEGTTEDISKLLQNGAFAGSRLKLIVDPAPLVAKQEAVDAGDEEDVSDSLTDSPFTVRDKVHLDELLLAGINSPKQKVTDQEWIDMRREVRERLAQRDVKA